MSTKTNTAPKTASKDDKASKETPKQFSLADAARDHGVNPKGARSKFRRLYAADDTSALPKRIVGGAQKWLYAMKDYDAVIALLPGKKA